MDIIKMFILENIRNKESPEGDGNTRHADSSAILIGLEIKKAPKGTETIQV